MSAPFTGLWALTSNLNGVDGSGGALNLTGVDPIFYDSGLVVQAAATNLFTNPTGQNNNFFWALTQAARTASANIPGTNYTALVTDTTATGATGANNTGSISGATAGRIFTAVAYLYAPAPMVGKQFRLRLSVNGGATGGATLADGLLTPGAAGVYLMSATGTIVQNDRTGFTTELRVVTRTIGDSYEAGLHGIFERPYAPYPFPTVNGAGTVDAGYAFTGTAHGSTSTRAASSASVAIAEPASIAAWYTETPGGSKTFAYIEPHGTIGTYGSVAWAAGDLTISSTRSLTIGPLAAFDRVLTAGEQAVLGATQNWSIGTLLNTGNPYINFQLRPY